MILGSCPVLRKTLPEHSWRFAEEEFRNNDKHIVVEICSSGWIHYIDCKTKKRITRHITPRVASHMLNNPRIINT